MECSNCGATVLKSDIQCKKCGMFLLEVRNRFNADQDYRPRMMLIFQKLAGGGSGRHLRWLGYDAEAEAYANEHTPGVLKATAKASLSVFMVILNALGKRESAAYAEFFEAVRNYFIACWRIFSDLIELLLIVLGLKYQTDVQGRPVCYFNPNKKDTSHTEVQFTLNDIDFEGVHAASGESSGDNSNLDATGGDKRKAQLLNLSKISFEKLLASYNMPEQAGIPIHMRPILAGVCICLIGGACYLFMKHDNSVHNPISPPTAITVEKNADNDNKAIPEPPKRPDPLKYKGPESKIGNDVKKPVASMAETEKQKNGNSTDKSNTVATENDRAKNSLRGYYQSITDRRMQDAYNTLSGSIKNHMGSYESFSKGYDATISSIADNIEITSSGKDQLVLRYRLTARDRIEKNRVQVQVFQGEATMKLENGNWYIVDMNVKKQSDHIE